MLHNGTEIIFLRTQGGWHAMNLDGVCSCTLRFTCKVFHSLGVQRRES